MTIKNSGLVAGGQTRPKTMSTSELIQRLEFIEHRLALLESLQKKGDMPEGFAYISVMAGAYGISTAKGEEMVRKAGIPSARYRNQTIANEEKFMAAVSLVLNKATRKVGSKYWYHPLVGNFMKMGAKP